MRKLVCSCDSKPCFSVQLFRFIDRNEEDSLFSEQTSLAEEVHILLNGITATPIVSEFIESSGFYVLSTARIHQADCYVHSLKIRHDFRFRIS